MKKFLRFVTWIVYHIRQKQHCWSMKLSKISQLFNYRLIFTQEQTQINRRESSEVWKQTKLTENCVLFWINNKAQNKYSNVSWENSLFHLFVNLNSSTKLTTKEEESCFTKQQQFKRHFIQFGFWGKKFASVTSGIKWSTKVDLLKTRSWYQVSFKNRIIDIDVVL